MSKSEQVVSTPIETMGSVTNLQSCDPAPVFSFSPTQRCALGQQHPPFQRKVALLTGGGDKPYAYGLTMELTSRKISVDVLGSDDVDCPDMHSSPHITFVNLRANRAKPGIGEKITRVLIYYCRLIAYAANAKPKIFHILWNNKFQIFDRTVLMLYYKGLGKKVVLTAHNVNAGKRDGNDSLLNRWTLKAQYKLADHIFVHTQKMKQELVTDFKIMDERVSVIPFGINNSIPITGLSRREARCRFALQSDERVILFFGSIRPYKGLEYLVDAFRKIAPCNPAYRLIIAGEPRREPEYLDKIQQTIASDPCRSQVIQKIEFIPDSETETYFKAADVLVLPYTKVFQSGVLFLAYNFGLPAITTDVGSFRDDVVPGVTGFVCRPCDPVNLARVITTYFESELFAELAERRHQIRDYANARNSWCDVGNQTLRVYAHLLCGRRHNSTLKLTQP